MTVQELADLILGQAGTLVMALVILFGGWKRWWVFGWQYREVSQEKNEWKEAALRGTKIAEQVVTLKTNGL